MSIRGISSPPYPAPLLYPDVNDSDPLVSYELGGVALNDPSQGLEVQVWTCTWSQSTREVTLTPTTGSPSVLFTSVGTVTALSIAFDSNMSPVVAYVDNGLQKLRWFNPLLPGIQTDSFDGAAQGRVATDDKRIWVSGLRDVVFAYVKDDNLYYREQRDKYAIERYVGLVEGRTFTRFGMGENLRMQFELKYT